MEKYKFQNFFTDGKNAKTGMCKKDGKNFIFKHSGCFSSAIIHEYRILKRLEQLNLPYFPKFIEFFHLDESCSDLLIMEYIDGQILETFPSSEKKKICMILLLIVEYTREKTGFVHYDLHSSNVLVKRVPRKTYTFRIKDKLYSIDNYGYLPVIIDFGCSYIDILEGKPISYRLDNFNDGCLFIKDSKVDMLRISLMSGFLSDELIDYLFPDSEKTFHLPSKFHRVLESILSNSPLDEELQITYRCIEILIQIVKYPFRKIMKVPSMKKTEFEPLTRELRQIPKKYRKMALYRIVHKYINHEIQNPRLEKCLRKLSEFLSTICYDLLKSNIKALNSVYKNFRVKTPLMLYEYLKTKSY